MIRQEEIRGTWHDIQSKIRARWSRLTNEELEETNGNVQKIVALVQQKTGASVEAIESYLNEIVEETEGATKEGAANVRDYAQHVAENASDYVNEVGESLQRNADKLAGSARTGYRQTERLIRKKPVESLATCFGVGLVTGMFVGIMLRSK